MNFGIPSRRASDCAPTWVKPFIINYLRLSLLLADEFAHAAQPSLGRHFLIPVSGR